MGQNSLNMMSYPYCQKNHILKMQVETQGRWPTMRNEKTVEKAFVRNIVPRSKSKEELIKLEEIGSNCLVEPLIEVESMQEYEYLLQESQRKLNVKYSPDSFWIEGYVIGIQAILSKENFHYVYWSLENGAFLTDVFALTEGLNENYLHFLSMVDIKPAGNQIPEDILVEKCSLLVVKKRSNGLETYQIQFILPWTDIMPAKELNNIWSSGLLKTFQCK